MTGVLIRKEYHVKRETHRNGHMKAEAKIKVMLSHTKECWGHQELKEARNRFLALPVCGTAALWTL